MKKILLIICILAVIVFTGCGSSNTFVIKEINLELVKCPAGSFMMGSPEEEEGRFIDEKTHLVTLTKHFYIGKYEVTQSQYSAIMDKNPSRFVGANNPVDTVSYEDAKAFCEKMNLKYLNILPAGYKFDLPTEAQWEYACRASTNTPFNNASKKNIDEVAWYGGNSSDTTHIVGQKKPNAWGIYDMHGNVWEWCRDWYGEYPNEDVIDPIGVYSGSYRVSRGGGWDNGADEYEVRRCRSAYRHKGFNPDKGNDLVGFRIALVPIN